MRILSARDGKTPPTSDDEHDERTALQQRTVGNAALHHLSIRAIPAPDAASRGRSTTEESASMVTAAPASSAPQTTSSLSTEGGMHPTTITRGLVSQETSNVAVAAVSAISNTATSNNSASTGNVNNTTSTGNPTVQFLHQQVLQMLSNNQGLISNLRSNAPQQQQQQQNTTTILDANRSNLASTPAPVTSTPSTISANTPTTEGNVATNTTTAPAAATARVQSNNPATGGAMPPQLSNLVQQLLQMLNNNQSTITEMQRNNGLQQEQPQQQPELVGLIKAMAATGAFPRLPLPDPSAHAAGPIQRNPLVQPQQQRQVPGPSSQPLGIHSLFQAQRIMANAQQQQQQQQQQRQHNPQQPWQPNAGVSSDLARSAFNVGARSTQRPRPGPVTQNSAQPGATMVGKASATAASMLPRVGQGQPKGAPAMSVATNDRRIAPNLAQTNSLRTVGDQNMLQTIQSDKFIRSVLGKTPPQGQSNPPTDRRVPCRARGMPKHHNSKTAYFVIAKEMVHAEPLLCSHKECQLRGVRFLYCKVCDLPVAERNFSTRHKHADVLQSKSRSKVLPAAAAAAAAVANSARLASAAAATTQSSVPHSTLPSAADLLLKTNKRKRDSSLARDQPPAQKAALGQAQKVAVAGMPTHASTAPLETSNISQYDKKQQQQQKQPAAWATAKLPANSASNKSRAAVPDGGEQGIDSMHAGQLTNANVDAHHRKTSNQHALSQDALRRSGRVLSAAVKGSTVSSDLTAKSSKTSGKSSSTSSEEKGVDFVHGATAKTDDRKPKADLANSLSNSSSNDGDGSMDVSTEDEISSLGSGDLRHRKRKVMWQSLLALRPESLEGDEMSAWLMAVLAVSNPNASPVGMAPGSSDTPTSSSGEYLADSSSDNDDSNTPTGPSDDTNTDVNKSSSGNDSNGNDSNTILQDSYVSPISNSSKTSSTLVPPSTIKTKSEHHHRRRRRHDEADPPSGSSSSKLSSVSDSVVKATARSSSSAAAGPVATFVTSDRQSKGSDKMNLKHKMISSMSNSSSSKSTSTNEKTENDDSKGKESDENTTMNKGSSFSSEDDMVVEADSNRTSSDS